MRSAGTASARRPSSSSTRCTATSRAALRITDDQIRESLEGAQLRLQRERGTDLTIFSPRASWMGHHVGNESTSIAWTEHCNDLIYRITQLYPDNFAGRRPASAVPGRAAHPLAFASWSAASTSSASSAAT